MTKTPPDIELSKAEQAWLRKQDKKAARAQGGKYVPHQGAREKARRRARVAAVLQDIVDRCRVYESRPGPRITGIEP